MSNKLDLNPQFEEALSLVMDTNEHVFITGAAGTGKTTLLHIFRRVLEKNFAIVAPTGIASIQAMGETIHRFFRLPTRAIHPEEKNLNALHSKNPFFRKKLEALETLIIDEISMVRADILQAIDKILRHYGDKDLPFGGKQIIFVGDLFQLPPVVVEEEMDWIIVEPHFPSPFFFDAPAFRSIKFKPVELMKNYRQTDEKFLEILDKFRVGDASFYDIQYINDRCYDPFMTDAFMFEENEIVLVPTNALAEDINEHQLNQLRSKPVFYEGVIEGEVQESQLPVGDLMLKPGTQVLFIKNHPSGYWVNGTVGRVKKCHKKSIEVDIGGEVYDVEPETWEYYTYKFDHKEKKVVSQLIGRYHQLPVKPAWAITIHKSQGMTMQKVALHFGDRLFASGQAYVALSRCRTLDGIRLLRPIRPQDIKTDSRVVDFYFTHIVS